MVPYSKHVIVGWHCFRLQLQRSHYVRVQWNEHYRDKYF